MHRSMQRSLQFSMSSHPSRKCTTQWTFFVVALMGCVSSVAIANVPPPPDPPPVERQVLIRQSDDKNYKIVIPVSMLKELKIAAADINGNAQPTDEGGYRSLLAALAISVGMVSLLFVRRKSTPTKVLMVMAVTGAAYFASHAYADLAPPRPRPRPSTRPATKPAPDNRRPMIEVATTRQRHSVILYVPAEKPAGRGDTAGLDSVDGVEGPPNAGIGSAPPAEQAPAPSRRK